MKTKKDNRELVKSILTLLFVMLLMFVFFELSLRIFWQEYQGYGYPEGLFTPDATKGYKYTPLFVGNFPEKEYKNIEIKINSKSIRDYEHYYKENDGIIRILGLGDSLTFGSGVSYEDSYLRQLEKKLWKDNFSLEIIKAGVNSYDFDQEYTYYFEEGYAYQPEIVMVGVALNDAKLVDPIAVKKAFFPSENENNFFDKIKHFLSHNFKSARFVYKLITINPQIEKIHGQLYFEKIYDSWQGEEEWKNYKTKLLSLNANLTKNNKKMILVLFPYRQQFNNSLNYGTMPQTKIKEVASQNNITTIDLLPYLDLPNYKEYYLYGDDVHLNAKGYALVANVIYDQLTKTKLLEINNSEKYLNKRV
jgi:lysophospholipase L1-like esterase